MYGSSGIPNNFSKAESHLIVKASKDHEAHGKCRVKAHGYGLTVLLQADLSKKNHFQKVYENKYGTKPHYQVSKPGEAQASVYVPHGLKG